MKLTREFFENNGWEREDEVLEDGTVIWKVTLNKRFENGDSFYANASVTNITCEDRFVMCGNITNNCSLSHLCLKTVEEYDKFLDLLGITKGLALPAPKSQGKEVEDFYITPNKEFFKFIYDRLRYVHKENPNTDYMLSLKARISAMEYLEQSKSAFKASNWYVSKVDGKIHDMTYVQKNKDEQAKWTDEDEHHT